MKSKNVKIWLCLNYGRGVTKASLQFQLEPKWFHLEMPKAKQMCLKLNPNENESILVWNCKDTRKNGLVLQAKVVKIRKDNPICTLLDSFAVQTTSYRTTMLQLSLSSVSLLPRYPTEHLSVCLQMFAEKWGGWMSNQQKQPPWAWSLVSVSWSLVPDLSFPPTFLSTTTNTLE